MNLDLVHFPNFKKTFFGSDFKTDILGLFTRIRDEISCRHIMHTYRQRTADAVRNTTPALSAVITVPTAWATRYSAKNYFSIDPIFREDAPYFRSDVSGIVRDLAEDAAKDASVAGLLQDAEKHGIGNLYVAVSARNTGGVPGCTLFTFETDGQNNAAFVAKMRPRLLSVSGIIHNALCGGKEPPNAANLLTPREVDCLRWAANGKTDGEIAEILSIARWTVVTYLQNAKIKLGCSNRTSAVATALVLGIIELPQISNMV